MILDRAGQFETLVLRRNFGSLIPAPSVQAADGHVPGVHNPDSLADVMRVEPTFASDQALKGVRVYMGRNRKAFASSGLRPGDLITAVDGNSIVGENPKEVLALFDRAKGAGSARLTVLRNGRYPIDLEVSYP